MCVCVCMYVCIYVYVCICTYVQLLEAAKQEPYDIHTEYNTTLVPCTVHVECARD